MAREGRRGLFPPAPTDDRNARYHRSPIMGRSPWIISVLPRRLKPAGARLHKAYRAGRNRAQRFVSKWLPPPKPVAVVPIKDFLHRAHITLLELQRRQFLLEAIDAEWPRITRGKPYWLHDDATFRAMGDVDAMNVVDLCSWAIGTYDTDESLLPRVKAHYLKDLPPGRRWRAHDEGEFKRLVDVHFSEARQRLFPKATGRVLKGTDADDLIDAFEVRVWPLREDRNKNKAHAHEHLTHNEARPLKRAEVRALYGYAREVLNDLCLVAFGATWSEVNLSSNSVSLTAEDLLDVVFLPQWFRRRMAGRMSREQVYDALHADPSPGPFNDKVKLAALVDRERPRRG